MSDNNERRQFQRISFDAPLSLSQMGNTFISHLLDISMKGVLIDASNLAIDITQPCTISIYLSTDVEIIMTAEWANHYKNAMAFRWLLIDIESMTHLRRLLELNTGDHTLIDRELALLQNE